ncbi:hypothetical protein [Polyangium sp. 15x6]|uniref:hypothetical protein n=1 Tax=Polyangium sp. 15x6 TaxID=3042687 RepID=UPI00249C7E7B|nr:hypothetical protein [Polyangium sp. 15x6]MDI3288372.1 hypothetical protein [Polyangium sp. 15x6]
MVIANDNDRALQEAVRGFLKRGELPVLLGLTSKIEYGMQYGFAACLTPARFFVVPVDVELSPGHRFAYPIKVKAKPGAKPVYDVNRAELRAIRLNAEFS